MEIKIDCEITVRISSGVSKNGIEMGKSQNLILYILDKLADT